MGARTPSSSHNGTSAVYSGPDSQKFFSSQLAADAGLADTKVANASAKTASRARIAVPTPVVLVATVPRPSEPVKGAATIHGRPWPKRNAPGGGIRPPRFTPNHPGSPEQGPRPRPPRYPPAGCADP